MSRIIRDITEITRCCSQFRADAFAPMGLKSCHASYLYEICANPGLSQDKLARLICINKSNVARQIAVLEEGGFVTRKPSETDKRIMELYPTEKALALLPRIQSVFDCLEEYLAGDLSQDEQKTLAALLGKMWGKASSWLEDHSSCPIVDRF